MGPLVTSDHLQKVQKFIEEEGAELVVDEEIELQGYENGFIEDHFLTM